MTNEFTVFNPATGRTIAEVPCADEEAVCAAVETADAAFRRWRERPHTERAGYLRLAADVIENEADALAALEVRENGKPFAQARYGDVVACIGMFRYFADLIEQHAPPRKVLGPIESVELLCPHGVVAGIIPFNWPPIHFAGKVAPALAVGNAVVLKPGEQAPLTVLRLVEIVAGVLPDPVLLCVTGGGEVGRMLIEHPLVRKVSFTGAPATGVEVMRSAARHLTPCLLELGGKNPFIICADADLDLACADAIEAAFVNQGEACTAASRILVDRRILAEVAARLALAVSRLKVGSGDDPDSDVGPLVSEAQQRKVLDYIRSGVEDDGAHIAAQAALPNDPELAEGYFVAPTLFVDVTPEMRIAREEIFGPVTCLIAFDDHEEAVAIANGTEFGLVSAIYSASDDTVAWFANRLEAGMVMVNNYSREFMGSPFGGIKASGFGREHCEATLHEFGYIRTLRLPRDQQAIRRWPAAARTTGGSS